MNRPTKRPSILDDLNLDAAISETEVADEKNATLVKAIPTKDARDKIVKTTVYLPPAVHYKLREIAFTTDCKVHDLIMEGISKVLTLHGHPDVEQLKKTVQW